MADDALPVPGTLLCTRGDTYTWFIVAALRLTYPTYSCWYLTLLDEGGLQHWVLHDSELQETYACR